MLAAKIAAAVRGWIASGAAVGAERRPLTAGDVLVLVRQRGPLFEAIIRALKNAGVAVAGADRLVLTEHIAIVDLMALADALLLPQDDLALAVALKSPLFGFDDDLLFELAWHRRAGLRATLAARAGRPAGVRCRRCAASAARRWRATRRRLRFSPGCSARSWAGGNLRAARARGGRCARGVPRARARL